MGNINLGDIVRDSISGYEGVVIGITDWIYGCRRLAVQSKGLHDGIPIAPVSIDEPQCVLVSEAIAEHKVEPLRKTGGPHTAATRRESPTRR